MTPAQLAAILALCERFSAPYREDAWSHPFDLPEGWVAGWVGTPGAGGIYAGVSPDGDVHT